MRMGNMNMYNSTQWTNRSDITFNEDEKWDGFTGTVIEYIGKISQKCQYKYEKSDPKTTIHQIWYNTTILLNTLYMLNINHVKKFRES